MKIMKAMEFAMQLVLNNDWELESQTFEDVALELEGERIYPSELQRLHSYGIIAQPFLHRSVTCKVTFPMRIMAANAP